MVDDKFPMPRPNQFNGFRRVNTYHKMGRGTLEREREREREREVKALLGKTKTRPKRNQNKAKT